MARFAAIRLGWVVGLLDAAAPPSLHVPVGMSFIDISNLPQVGVGDWHYDSATGVFSEDPMSTQKQQFLTTVRDQMTETGQMIEKTKSLISAFVDRGYDAAASDPITDADLVEFGVIVYDLGIAINLMQQLQALMAQPAFEATVSRWREL